jgi:hypothetical protein
VIRNRRQGSMIVALQQGTMTFPALLKAKGKNPRKGTVLIKLGEG